MYNIVCLSYFYSKLNDQHALAKLSETKIQISQVLIQVQKSETDKNTKQIMIVWSEEVSLLIIILF